MSQRDPALERLLDQARDLLADGKSKKALAALEKAPPALRGHPELLAVKGRALMDLDRAEEARETLEAAARGTKDSPPSVEAILELGWWDLDADDFEAARDRAEAALRQPALDDWARESAHGLLIEALLDLGERQAAREALARLEAGLGRDHPAARLGRGRVLFHEGKFEEALAELTAARKADPEAAWAWWWEAVALERLGRMEEAERGYREANRRDPDGHHLPVRVSDAELDGLIEEALAELPDEIRAELGETCLIVREDFPHPVRVRDEGVDPFLLGECIGTAELTRLREHAGYRAVDHGLTEVMVYRRNLERWCRDREELLEEVSVTLHHEIGHALGLDEDGVAALGLE